MTLKSVTDERTFTGLASSYGNTELQGDTIQLEALWQESRQPAYR
jgi:hypothetical protein